MKYVKGNFLPTRQFRDMADLNAQVRDWVPQVAGQRIHGTTRLRTPHMCLQEGKPRWQGLPDGLARRLHIYYVNGGQLNIDGFYAPLSAHVAGKAASGIADPIMSPRVTFITRIIPALSSTARRPSSAGKGPPRSSPSPSTSDTSPPSRPPSSTT